MIRPTINIVTEPSPGWVLRWISESLKKEIPMCTITDFKPDINADFNIYVNHILFKGKVGGKDIGIFTHMEPGDEAKWEQLVKNYDWCFPMSKKTYESFPFPKEKTTILTNWVDPQFEKEEIIFGLIGTEKIARRKRYEWVKSLIDIPRARFVFTNGTIPWRSMPGFYRGIDYLLITSEYEGGPLPVIEAISMGKPVISTDVGYSWDYPVIKYNTLEELREIILKLTCPIGGVKLAAKQIMDVIMNGK